MESKGKVLLVDDEEIIIDVSKEVLRFLGYDAVFAREGRAAMDLYRQEKEAGRPFDLVIIDLTMPEGMDGRETIEKLREYDSSVKAVVSSGYANDPVVQDFGRYGFSGRLTKPYRINEMKAILEELIQK
ncbi:response regulator [Methanoregula sp. UBA64]|jgi:CheY-like chemotaxis protein|uniref:response regulator n=1 Tax=Methanoregula sp. UBA64 TaxID=1915554 RepID=UPI0025D8B4A7|nr:response regulator [Methanoregula sp. UBA64]